MTEPQETTPTPSPSGAAGRRLSEAGSMTAAEPSPRPAAEPDSRGGELCVLDYTEQAMDAERRMRRGERQVWCGTCVCWQWADGCAHDGRLTMAQFRALTREMARRYPVRRTPTRRATGGEQG